MPQPSSTDPRRPLLGWLVVALVPQILGWSSGCVSAAPPPSSAYIVTPSHRLRSSLQNLEIIDQRWSLMRQRLASANEAYGNMSEAWNLVLGAVEHDQPTSPAAPESSAGQTPAAPCGSTGLTQLGEELTAVRLDLMGRRSTLSPAVLDLLERERQLVTDQATVGELAPCP